MSELFNKRWRKNFLAGKKPRKKDYWQYYPYSGDTFDELMYDYDMDDYKNSKL